MSPDQELPDGLIWATRGRSWGFRFLLTAGLSDPLPVYDRVFADVEDAPAAFHRTDDGVALRLPDPLGRRDAAGRLIPHEFVVLGERAEMVVSVESGLQQVWPLVAGVYARVWDAEEPPSGEDPSHLE